MRARPIPLPNLAQNRLQKNLHLTHLNLPNLNRRLLPSRLLPQTKKTHKQQVYYFQRSTILLFILPLFFFETHLNQPQQTQKEYSETVEVDLVDVYLSATDSKGRAIDDLKPEELILKEDNVVQQITDFSVLGTRESDVDLVVALVIDVSNSMHEGTREVRKMDIAKDAAREIIRLLKPQDRIMLVAFDTRIAIKTDLKSNLSEVEGAISNLQPNYGRTALWDAIHAASESIKGEEGRKVIFICSDGLDNASTMKMEQVVAKDLGASEITVVALGTIEFERGGHWHGQESDYRQGKETMQMLADRTGGYAFFPERVKEIAGMLQRVRSGVLNLYSMAYRSSNPEKDGSWRKIEIETKRRGVRLRYREGYYAEP